MSRKLIVDETVPVEIVTDNDRDEWFVKKLEEFLHKQNKEYAVWINNDHRWYNSENCKIIIASDFSCGDCHKCHVKRGCNVSKEFDLFIQRHGYKCEFLHGCCAGLFRWD